MPIKQRINLNLSAIYNVQKAISAEYTAALVRVRLEIPPIKRQKVKNGKPIQVVVMVGIII